MARKSAVRTETPSCECIPEPPPDGGPWIPRYTIGSGWDYKNDSLVDHQVLNLLGELIRSSPSFARDLRKLVAAHAAKLVR